MRQRGVLLVLMIVVVSVTGVALTMFARSRLLPSDPAVQGAVVFSRSFRPEHGLGPLFTATACVTCHDEPVVGGMGRGTTGTVLRVGRFTDTGFDSLEGRGGPVARTRSVAEFGSSCSIAPGIPPEANVTSVRNAPTLFGLGLIDAISDDVLLDGARQQQSAGRVQGIAHRVIDTNGRERIGRFGWKSQTAALEEFVGDAFRTELGITNPLAPADFVALPADASCGTAPSGSEDDGTLVRVVTAYIMTLEAPGGHAEETQPMGASVFRQIGCAECHTPSLPTKSGTAALYSDLLLHDLGPSLDDGVTQGQASGRHWRTTPLWGLRLRGRLLHDARATTIAAAITAHGGEAAPHTAQFRALSPAEREALLAFLGEL